MQPPAISVLPPLALYVHLPWCVRKCPYCDFNSHEHRGPLPTGQYVDALLADLDAAQAAAQGRSLRSIFIGGGTPSLFPAAEVARLLAGIAARLPLAADAEVTLEANPGTAEADRFHGYREAGVNRLSLGVQSFDPAQLRRLGRIHDEREARRAVELAQASFERVNLDLMYALPEQDEAAALADARTALATGVTHLSFYQLTLEPNTVFFSRPPPLPDDDAAAAIEAAVHAELAAGGYGRYEVSAWARPGAECRHNLNYWWFGDYLGIGAGAHAKLSSPQGIRREARSRVPADYLRRAPTGDAVAERRELSAPDAVFEFMMNALRLPRGFPEKLFSERTGLPLAAAEPALTQALQRGLLERSRGEIRPTPLGLRFLNNLVGLFLAAGPGA
ncbi:MAG: coproporphyrinogen III oxidase [Gammaproteobacteria bacterium]|nr:oxygen-independent coproporphyrinogen III oxidase-like protein [Gammaproteobacteria bacterium]MCE7897340.1 oxygen-independent coproporphyrinogen III oxidase-like protein [Gammaproteobacteria bacterium PRO8]MDL1881523.1 oxygen-independent coproporphyrinogen III oxidase-like protein [Gammaproteobacteria bacterium PRO2]GIK34834.1 MAG: coproporphyrinogen III oxidase [Gammaproteobacteria bacterium]